jgi:Zn-dependent protease
MMTDKIAILQKIQDLSTVQQIVVWALPVIFALTVHEVAHGWVAKKHGDNTAYAQGRLTLNPIEHIDIFGTIILPGMLLLLSAGFVFGWAKPVPVNGRYFKNPRRDMAMVAAAGPASNLLMAIIWALCVRVGFMIDNEAINLPIVAAGLAGVQINLVFAVLNLIPIPPLDGSRIITAMLSHQMAYKYNQLEPYGFYILIILMMTPILSLIMGFPLSFLMPLFYSIAGMYS